RSQEVERASDRRRSLALSALGHPHVPGLAGAAMTVLLQARTWFGASTNRRILGATATVAMLSLVVRAVSLGKDLVVAYRFGTGDALDAFLIALLLPTFAINVVASSLNSAFVPIFIQLR